MYIYICMYICICIYINIHIYIYSFVNTRFNPKVTFAPQGTLPTDQKRDSH